MRPLIGVLAMLAIGLAACQKPAVDGGWIARPKADSWPSYGRNYGEQRFSPLLQIDTKTVGRLGPAWWAAFDTDRGQEATPLEADGVLYTTTAWSKVFAFDAKTGRRLWSYDPKVPGEKGVNACCDVVNRGVALWEGRVYVGTLDGRLIALDAKTGAPVWSVQTTDPGQPYTITGAPRAAKGLIFIGNGGAEYPVRGYVSAYDAATGALKWRFYTTPNPNGRADGAASDGALKRLAANTWGAGAWTKAGGGGTVWDAITYDPKTDLVYVGVGNAAPWNDRIRTGTKGDNLFTASIVALRADTGAYVWHYQTTPRDAWDYDADQQLVTADLELRGATRHVLMQANKNGFFYVLDAATGGLLSADKFVPVNWAERIDLATGRPVESAAARYAHGDVSRQITGPLGGHNWQPMAYDPRARVIYIPTQVMAGHYEDPQSFSFIQGAWNVGLGGSSPTPSAPGPAAPVAVAAPYGELIAWDPVAGKRLWTVRSEQAWAGGVLATGGGLVFRAQGRQFTAYDARTGKALWSYDTVAPAIAPAMTYSVDGVQYVALMVGFGGSGGILADQPRREGRLLVFKIDGTERPAPYAPVAPAPALALTGAEAARGDADRGAEIYDQFCSVCHDGGVFLPNLPRSPAILSHDGLSGIVLGGALKDQGMASFSHVLSDKDVEDLRSFLLWKARHDDGPRPANGNHPQ